MLTVYIFCLVLGGGFLALSLLGDLLGDASGDVAFEGDVGLDADLGLDAADAADAADALDAADVDSDIGHAAVKIFSIRTLVYGLFGFGAVGTALSLVGAGGALLTPVYATAGGVLSGGLATTLFNWLRRTESGARHGDDAFIGLTGVVTLPLSRGTPGTVAVERGGRRVSLRALPHATAAGSSSADWTTVVVVEMSDGIARVAPVEDELAPGSARGDLPRVE